jgi:GSCFA family protein
MRHPYTRIADYARWSKGVAELPMPDVDPVVRFPLKLTREQPIVTAGSCFAQHIARYLKKEEFNHLVTEPGHPRLSSKLRETFNYGLFSARYGNVYTSRQLEQLFRRAYGQFVPEDSVWPGRDGTFIDPFRPTIQPNGFRTPEELDADRDQHLAAVRRAFEQLEVFVFTFGLTECWAATADGAVFPLAPGIAGGIFDPDRYVFVNLGVDDVVSDMTTFIESLRDVNRAAKVVLTVSPVPLNATAVDRHVLVSTTYSKSVLRVATQILVESLDDVYYFPSYEIVTGNFARGKYFAEDLRSIREAGVRHVMRLFFQHATAVDTQLPADGDAVPAPAVRSSRKRMAEVVEVLCDEEFLTLG